MNEKHIPLVLGSIFLPLGLMVMVFFGQESALTCTRSNTSQGRCELIHSGLLGAEVQDIDLSDLQGVKVDASKGKSSYTYRVVLATKQGEMPFTNYWSSDAQPKETIAAQVRNFIGSPDQKSLEVRQDDRLFGYLVGGLFGGIGLIALVLAVILLVRVPPYQNVSR